MHIRKVKFWLWVGSCGMMICTAGVAALGYGLPYPQKKTPGAEPGMAAAQSPRAQTAQSGDTLPPAKDPVWRTPLRKPLADPPPPPPTPRAVAGKAPPLRVRLLGTIIEPGWSMALVAAGTKQQWIAVGDTVSQPGPRKVYQAEVLAIDPHRITFQYDGKKVIFSMPKSGEKS